MYYAPAKVVFDVFKTGYFNLVLWDNFMAKNIGQPFLMGSFFYFELLFNVSIVVFSVFMIVLQVQKRTTFPIFYIWFRITLLRGLLLDTVLSFILKFGNNSFCSTTKVIITLVVFAKQS